MDFLIIRILPIKFGADLCDRTRDIENYKCPEIRRKRGITPPYFGGLTPKLYQHTFMS